MNALSPVDRAVLQVAVLTWLAKQVKAADADARMVLARQMTKGMTLPARSPVDDVRLGRAMMSDPKPAAVITDRVSVEEWVRRRYPEKLVSRREITGSMAEALDVLQQHAPHLVEDVKSVPDWAVSELLKRAESMGFPIGFGGEVGPDAPEGITVRIPDGVLSVRLDPAAEAAIERMWQAGLIELGGGLKMIEGAA